jgi:hypothetical protein
MHTWMFWRSCEESRRKLKRPMKLSVAYGAQRLIAEPLVA